MAYRSTDYDVIWQIPAYVIGGSMLASMLNPLYHARSNDLRNTLLVYINLPIIRVDIVVIPPSLKDPAMAKKQKRKGVTLIELMIVVLILATLAAIAIPRISQIVYNAKRGACETNIDILNSAIERYYATNGAFPPNLRVIQRDTNLFPDGRPKCPITGAGYRFELTAVHRVKTNLHNH